MLKKTTVGLLATAFVLAGGAAASAADLSPIESLGKALFFDRGLSNPPGQSCADCHDPLAGWSGPDSAINAAGAVYEGAVLTRFGNRKPPSSAYAGFNPNLHRCGDATCGCGAGGGMDCGGGVGGGGMGGGGGIGGGGMGGDCGTGGGMMCGEGEFAGGLFWDGRATGWSLYDPLAEQAMGPFLNPLEQNSPNPRLVCIKVRESGYAALFETVWGDGELDCVNRVDETYGKIARSIAAFERSAEVNPFSSKFDEFFRNVEERRSAPRSGVPPVHMINGMNFARFQGLGLNEMELKGLVVFNTKGKCSTCHLLRPMRDSGYPLFTDFRYHNLGIPKNLENPYYGMPRPWNRDGLDWIDPGLGGFLARTEGAQDAEGNDRDYTAYAAENFGKHRTPTLRNVEMRPYPGFVKSYGHNGHFKSLMLIVHFYNFRDRNDLYPIVEDCAPEDEGVTCWPPPEVSENINATDMGNLGLTPQEGMALIAFINTLTDGFAPAP